MVKFLRKYEKYKKIQLIKFNYNIKGTFPQKDLLLCMLDFCTPWPFATKTFCTLFAYNLRLIILHTRDHITSTFLCSLDLIRPSCLRYLNDKSPVNNQHKPCSLISHHNSMRQCMSCQVCEEAFAIEPTLGVSNYTNPCQLIIGTINPVPQTNYLPCSVADNCVLIYTKLSCHLCILYCDH